MVLLLSLNAYNKLIKHYGIIVIIILSLLSLWYHCYHYGIIVITMV